MTFPGRFRPLISSYVTGTLRRSLNNVILRKFAYSTRTPDALNMDAPLVVTDTTERVRLIGINRPSKRNCVDPPTADQLVEAFRQFDIDTAVDVAVFYGVGGCFCSGFDLSALSKTEIPTTVASLNEMRNSAQDSLSVLERSDERRPMGPSMLRLSKPVIGAIGGYAVAGGLEMALICDMRVVERSAKFGVFCRRWGVPLIDGGTIRLPKLIGLSRAMDMILTGREIDAETAYQWGLANRIVNDGTALAEAVSLARSISTFPQECLRADRKSAYYSSFDATSFEDSFQFEFDNGLPVVAKESISGATKFAKGSGRHGSFAEFATNNDNKSKL